MDWQSQQTVALGELAVASRLDPAVQASRRQQIRDELLRTSRHVIEPDFRCLGSADLTFLYGAYDSMFFRGACQAALGSLKLTFRVSSRLTKAAGKTFRFVPRAGGPPHFEIAISSTLLYQTFRDVDRSITVCGCICDSRVEALMRILEHELIHLVELVCWKDSECAAPRFQGIARGVFGHQAHTHALITQLERAAAQFGIRPGDRVAFEFAGRRLTGVVNRITRRATILVEDPTGQPYSDGRRYLKFYIPIEMLQRV